MRTLPSDYSPPSEHHTTPISAAQFFNTMLASFQSYFNLILNFHEYHGVSLTLISTWRIRTSSRYILLEFNHCSIKTL